MTGEKKETWEMKQRLGKYFQKGEMEEAKQYFLRCLSERPDVMMEASDIMGDLRICMQVISTWEYEMAAGIKPEALSYETLSLSQILERFRQLNCWVESEKNDAMILKKFSKQAISVAVEVVKARKS